MGQELCKAIEHGHISHAAQSYSDWPLNQMKELVSNYKKLNCGFALVKSQLHSWMHAASPAANTTDESQMCQVNSLFDLFDSDQNGRIDALEFLGGISMIGSSSFDDKIRFCFEIFDFNMNGSMSVCEMVLMARSILLGICKIYEIPEIDWPDDMKILKLVEEAYRIYDKDRSRTLAFPEFISWARGHEDVQNFIAVLPGETKRFGGENGEGRRSRKSVNIKHRENKTESTVVGRSNIDIHFDDCSDEDTSLLGDEAVPETDEIENDNGTDYLSDSGIRLELDRIHGFSCKAARNNIKSFKSKIIYPAGNIIVVCDEDDNQCFYTGHTKDIRRIDIHPGEQIVASIENGEVGGVHIWDAKFSPPKLILELRTLNKKSTISDIAMSPDGELLATCAHMPECNLLVWDWKSKKVLVSTKLEKITDIRSLSWSPDGRKLLVCGSTKIATFRFRQQMDSTSFSRGSVIEKGNQDGSSFTCAKFMRQEFIAGTTNGDLYQCRNGSVIRVISAHDKSVPVTSLEVWPRGLISGGEDGSVKFWDLNVEELSLLNCSLHGPVSSICYDDTNNSAIISTMYGKIIKLELSLASDDREQKNYGMQLPSVATDKIQSHYGKNLLSIATHPNRECYSTVGDDGYIRTWDSKLTSVVERDMMSPETANSGIPCSISYSQNGLLLAVGFSNGGIRVVSAETLQDKFRCSSVSKSIVDVVSFSPDGNSLLVAHRIGHIYLYDISKAMDQFYKNSELELRCTNMANLGLNRILRVDWSKNGKLIRASGQCESTNSNASEVVCWSFIEKAKVKFGNIDQLDWYSHNCTTEANISSHDFAEKSKIFAKTYSNGKICVGRDSDFDGNNKNLTSANALGVATKDIKFLNGELQLASISNSSCFSAVWNIVKADIEDIETKEIDDDHDSDVEDDILKYRNAEDNHQEACSDIPQWKSSIIEPLSYADKVDSSTILSALNMNETSADTTLELQWIQGGNVTWNSVKFIGTQDQMKVVYPAASMCIAQPYRQADEKKSNIKLIEKTQERFQRSQNHSNLVTCVAVAKDKNIFVCGEKSGEVEGVHEECYVTVWNLESKQPKATLALPWTKGGVARVAISPDSDLISVFGGDEGHSVAVYKWTSRTPLIGVTKYGKNHTMGVCWTWDNEKFVSCGVKHLTLWTIGGTSTTIEPSRGLYGKDNLIQTALCVSSSTTDGCVVTGMMDGSLYFWSIDKLARVKRVINGVHTGPVNAVIFAENTVISGGKDGFIKQYSLTEKDKDPNTASEISSFEFPIRSLDYRILDNSDDEPKPMVLAGLKNNSIFTVSLDNTDSGEQTEGNQKRILQGHYGFSIWGVAIDKKKEIFATVGDDQFLRVWQLPNCIEIASSKLRTKGRAVDISEDGQIAVGLVSGDVEMFALSFSSEENHYVLEPGSELNGHSEKNDWVSVVKFSPAILDPGVPGSQPISEYLAVGSHDSNIYIYFNAGYGQGQYEFQHMLEGHTGFINHFDWSIKDLGVNRYYMRSTSGSKELFFWNVSAPIRIKSSQHIGTVNWSSSTCPYGWSLQGLYDDTLISGSTDMLKSCDVSNGRTVIACGSADGLVKTLNYPVPSRSNVRRFKTYRAHSSGIMGIAFSANDRYIVSIGSTDNCICVWKTTEMEKIYMARAGKTSEELDELLQKQSRDKVNPGSLSEPSSVQETEQNGDEYIISSKISKPDQSLISCPSLNWKKALEKMGAKDMTRYNDSGSFCTPLLLKWVYGHSFGSIGHLGRDSGSKKFAFVAETHVIVKDLLSHGMNIQDYHSNLITCLVISHNGRYLATGDKDGECMIWDSHKCSIISHFETSVSDSGPITSISFSVDDTLIGICRSKVLDVYRISDSAIISTGQLEDNSEPVIKIIFIRSELIVTVSASHLQFWTIDVTSTLLQCKTRNTPSGDTQFTSAAFVQESILTGHENGNICSWNVQGVGNCVASAPNGSAVLALEDRKDKVGFISGHDFKVILWGVQKESRSKYIRESVLELPSAAVDICCKSLSTLISTKDGAIVEWDLAKLEKPYISKMVQIGNMPSVAFALLDQSPVMVNVSSSGCVQLWNIECKKEISRYHIEDSCTNVAANRHIAVATVNAKIFILSKDLKKCIKESQLKCTESNCTAMKYSPDGQTLASCYGNKIYLLETRYYAVKSVLSGHTSIISHIDWSSDSWYIQSNSFENGQLLFWNLPEKTPIDAEDVENVAWSTNNCPFSLSTLNCWKSKLDPLISCAMACNSKRMVYGYSSGLSFKTEARGSNHTGTIKQLSFAFNDRYIIALMNSGTILQYTY